MDLDAFWRIIRDTRTAASDDEAFRRQIDALPRRLTPEELLEFQGHFYKVCRMLHDLVLGLNLRLDLHCPLRHQLLVAELKRRRAAEAEVVRMRMVALIAIWLALGAIAFSAGMRGSAPTTANPANVLADVGCEFL